MKADTDTVGPDHNLILADTIAEANMTPTKTTQGHATGIVDATTEVLPGMHTPVPINTTLTKTPHIRDHLHTVLLLTQGNHDLNQHINQPRRLCTKIHHDSGYLTVIHTLSKTPESQ